MKQEMKKKLNLFELTKNELSEVKGSSGPAIPLQSACFGNSPDPRF